MKVDTLLNPTASTIETDVVRNGLWPGWTYIIMSEVSDTEVARLRELGVKVYANFRDAPAFART